ncbi:thermonuclease family protein [Oryzicola mucosus]|uniref:Thermonuclease family protein n=1 Tax=Oryzicola mucosus TaxID=2767425 RepID=A0A8J6PM97_9HYPH|nr:thermonuclease family protein [Oryzicola mucosus]MBD0413805.1 thermonuclease family protein [Oryzicola mucosus]
MRSGKYSFVVLCSVLLLVGTPARTENRSFAGPVEATVIDVLDGDTFLAEAKVWPGHSVRVNIRIRGIDAPEMRSRCESEREAAHRARDALAALLGARPILLSNIGGAKYYGRVLADVASGSGEVVAEAMLASGKVRAYDGGRRYSWCG